MAIETIYLWIKSSIIVQMVTGLTSQSQEIGILTLLRHNAQTGARRVKMHQKGLCSLGLAVIMLVSKWNIFRPKLAHCKYMELCPRTPF